MAAAVFVLCALTCIACLAFLARAYHRSRGRLVFWTAICFAGLALNNVLIAINQLIFRSVHMPWRAIPAALGLVALAYGLIAEEVRARVAVPRREVTRPHDRVTT